MGIVFDFFCSNLPTLNQAQLDAIESLTQKVLALNAITPLNNVSMVMNDVESTHQFQVVTVDARAWIDVLDATAPYSAQAPGLIRHPQSTTSEWAYPEWKAIIAIRDDIYALHVALGHPDLIRFLFGSSTSVILAPSPSTAVHGTPNAFMVNYFYVGAGHTDWIGMFKVGDPNTSYGQYHVVPDLQTAGTFLFDAPATPGSYEFRYLPANGFVDIGRSLAVTVT